MQDSDAEWDLGDAGGLFFTLKFFYFLFFSFSGEEDLFLMFRKQELPQKWRIKAKYIK